MFIAWELSKANSKLEVIVFDTTTMNCYYSLKLKSLSAGRPRPDPTGFFAGGERLLLAGEIG